MTETEKKRVPWLVKYIHENPFQFGAACASFFVFFSVVNGFYYDSHLLTQFGINFGSHVQVSDLINSAFKDIKSTLASFSFFFTLLFLIRKVLPYLASSDTILNLIPILLSFLITIAMIANYWEWRSIVMKESIENGDNPAIINLVNEKKLGSSDKPVSIITRNSNYTFIFTHEKQRVIIISNNAVLSIDKPLPKDNIVLSKSKIKES